MSANIRKNKILFIVTTIVLALVIGCTIYLSDYYKADDVAINNFESGISVSKHVNDDDTIVYTSENIQAGFIFYPGGKVEHTAYEPLMKLLASKGIMCVLVKMPFNLAVLDIDAAEGLKDDFPNIDKWYIGGHSLGGSMAASYLSKNADDFAGLILLGSYSTTDLSSYPIDVLSIYGSEDKILNYEKYEENKSNLPDNMKEVVIKGGCHAYFGMYGFQDGDGEPDISNEEQIEITTQEICNFTGVN